MIYYCFYFFILPDIEKRQREKRGQRELMKSEGSSRCQNVPGGHFHSPFHCLVLCLSCLASMPLYHAPYGGGKHTHQRIFRGNVLALSCVADEHVYINERRIIFASGFLVSPLSPSTLWQRLSVSIASTIVICAATTTAADCYVHVTNDLLSVIFLPDSPQTNFSRTNEAVHFSSSICHYDAFSRYIYLTAFLKHELIARI